MHGAAFRSELAGVVQERDGFSGDCARFTQNMLKSCIDRYGRTFTSHACVAALRFDGERVTGVETTDGRVFDADAVVLANGAWAPALAQAVDVWLPVVPVRGYSLEVPTTIPHSEALDEQFRRFPNCLFPHCKLAATGFADAEGAQRRLRFTSVAEFVRVDAPASEAMTQYLRDHVTALYPELGAAVGRCEVRVGSRPQTPDDLPIVSGTRYSNLFVNVGGCSTGWRFGCGMSAILASLLAEGSRCDVVDVRQLSLKRFQWPLFLNRAGLSHDTGGCLSHVTSVAAQGGQA